MTLPFKATTTKIDASAYDAVFIGYPIWWYDLPDPLADFLEKNDLGGKTVYVFCTHGGSRLLRTIDAIQKAQPNAKVNRTGFDVRDSRAGSAKADVSAWLKEVGVK